MKNKGFLIVMIILLTLLLAAAGLLLWQLKPWEEKPDPGTESSASIESELSEESEESKEVFPTATSEELGLYVETASSNIRYVVNDHHERQSEYDVDEDGNIRTVSGKPVIAAENATPYSVITEIENLLEEYTVTLDLYDLGDAGFAYEAAETEIPLTMKKAVDNRWSAEIAEGDCIEDLQTEEGGFRFTALHSGTAKIRIKNAAGKTIAELSLEMIYEKSDDEIDTEAILDRINACQHEYNETVIEPTFENGGVTVHECYLCGHVFYSDETEPLPCEHNWGESKVVSASCKEGGYTIRTCTICGKEERTDETPADAHKWGDTKTVAPTCSAEGYSTHTCTVCGTQERFNVTAKTAHAYVDTVVAPTYREKGYTEHKCSVCGYTFRDHETAKIPCPGHNYEITEQTEPTCTAKGRTVKVCSICGKTETTEATALDHSWGEWAVTKPATEEATGTKQRTCSRCHQTETETLPKICLHHEQTEGWYGIDGNTYFGSQNPSASGIPCLVDRSHTNCPYTYYWYSYCYKCGETMYREATQYDQKAANNPSLVLDRLYYYLNQYRATYAGLGPHVRDSIYEQYAGIRANQLVTNFAHDSNDKAVARAQMQIYGVGGECIANIPGTSRLTVDSCAQAFIDGFYHSSRHWEILSSTDYSWVGIGYNSQCYVCINVAWESGADSHQRYLESLVDGD